MITPHDREIPVSVRKLSLLNIFYPCLVHANWIVMFRLTRDCACVATDTLAIVDDKAVVGNSTTLYMVYGPEQCR